MLKQRNTEKNTEIVQLSLVKCYRIRSKLHNLLVAGGAPLRYNRVKLS